MDVILETREFNENSSVLSRCLIIMPIYNRRQFLQQAFQSLKEQTFSEWNLVIVDDGSCDQPIEAIEVFSKQLRQHITYIKRSNGGPGAARATGQTFITTQPYVAFFDSDDYWLPLYLETALNQLESISELDWVFCPCRRVEYCSGTTLLESTLVEEETGDPLGFQSLPVQRRGNVFVFKDNQALALAQLKQPIHAGFQNSVIRAALALDIRIPEYRIGEDRYFLLAAILRGYNIGYTTEVGVIYHVHESNFSDTNRNNIDITKMVAVQKELCRSFSDIKTLTQDKRILRAAGRQRANIKFWIIAYHYYWQSGCIGKSLSTMAAVAITHPTDWRYLKTFLLSVLRAPMMVLRNTNKSGH